jgi:hypothetical protein
MAKGRTRRAAVSLPALPRGLKTASPKNARKLMASINHCGAALYYQRETLKRNLRSHGRQMPPKLLRQYKQTLEDLNKAYALVNGIGCAGPFMSFELPLLMGHVQPAKKVKARGR